MDDPSDAEFAVSDLREEQSKRAHIAPTRFDNATYVTKVLARRITPTRRRLIGSVLAIVGVVLVLALALREYSAATRGATTDVAGNTRSRADSALYFKNLAPWGVLRLDGRAVDIGKLSSEQSPYFLHLGATKLDYTAPPYPALHCVVSDPPARGDTCPLITQYGPEDPVQTPDEGRLIDLRANLNRLSPTQFAGLEQATEGAIAALMANPPAEYVASVQLAPGDHYLNAQGQVSVATQPLRAALQFTFDRAALVNTNPLSGPPCRVFCAYGANNALQAPVTPAWVYTPIGADSPATQGPFLQAGYANIPDNGNGFLQIDVHWNSGWRVSIEPYFLLSMGQQFCANGAAALGSLVNDPSLNNSQEFGVGDAQGCGYTLQPPGTAGPNVAPNALFLYRCGVFLAANQVAHVFAPNTSAASPAEAQAAQAMAV